MRDLIDTTAWVDTHEHLVDERLRTEPGSARFHTGGREIVIPDDWSALLVDYAIKDLCSAGLGVEEAGRVCGDELSPVEKWDLAAPYVKAARATGYMRAVDLGTERLFGQTLARETCEDIGGAMAHLRAEPRWYARVLREAANVERCQIHSLDRDPFEDRRDPLLEYDLSLYPLLSGRHEELERASGIAVASLDDYLDVLEWSFEAFGTRAVAAKCNWAYVRPLRVSEIADAPRAEFERLRRGDETLADRRLVEDFLFGRALEHAGRLGLPVKLHLGYLSGIHRPELPWIFDHVVHTAALVQRHPDVQFVLMHMAWPQQEQLMALAKHAPNVTIDLCWAWILAPRATREFVAGFLTTVPSNKLLCFGGDYIVVENVVGHAALARRGLQGALELLVREEWFTAAAAEELVEPLMRGNANALFPRRRPSR